MSHGIKKAVILCGGKGTRLRPVTYEIPKSLVPVQGKPVLEHIINLLKKYSINDIILSVGYLKEKVIEYFGDGSSHDVNITYVEEKEPLGTAGPLRLANPGSTFIVSNGDELKEINIDEMHDLHKSSNALATIALTRVENPRLYGVARLDGNKILEFVEKPENPPSNLINAGFYIMEPEVISMIPEGPSMLEKDVFPDIAKKERLFGFPFSGQWFDVGNMDRWEIAMKNWKGI